MNLFRGVVLRVASTDKIKVGSLGLIYLSTSYDQSQTRMSKRTSSNLAAFKEELASAKHVVVLTGAGVSAESGVPTFRGPGGYWRKWQATDLATPQAFARNPSLVWEFYQYRRDVMLSKKPNAAHYAIAECEKRFEEEGKRLVVVTQNIDELHRAAGSKNIIELHGIVWLRFLLCIYAFIDLLTYIITL